MSEIVFLLIFIINIPIVIFYKKITKIICINDSADNVRKLHKTDIPLFGGILITFNIIIFSILDFFVNFNLINELYSTREYFSFYLGIILYFLLGIFDDKFDLSANKKLLFNIFILIILIFLDNNLVIKQLNFSFLENPIELRNFSYPFTILCILLFSNALNMFDGINLQTATYCLIIFLIFLFKDVFFLISITLICVLILFLFYNFFNRMFLGDSGTYVLSFLISYILIKSHNIEQKFGPEEIFIILSLPGLDMFRLFLLRIWKGKSPFESDRNHIHHLILKKFSSFQTFLIIQVFIISNLLVFYFVDNKLNVLFINISSYLILFLYFFLERKNN